jgi:hypothetical protein
MTACTIRIRSLCLLWGVFPLSGCGSAIPEEPVVSESPAANSQHRIFAESYVLRAIGEFDAAAQSRLMAACEGAPYQSADEAVDDFGASESVTQAQVEWIEATWQERRSKDPASDPKAFAAEVANEVFFEVEF